MLMAENTRVISGNVYHHHLIMPDVSVFGAGFENNLSVGQVAQKINKKIATPR